MSHRKSQPNCPRLDLTAYRGQWVALDPKTNRVVGHAVSLPDAEHAAAKNGVAKPLLLSVPTSNAYFVGLAG